MGWFVSRQTAGALSLLKVNLFLKMLRVSEELPQIESTFSEDLLGLNIQFERFLFCLPISCDVAARELRWFSSTFPDGTYGGI